MRVRGLAEFVQRIDERLEFIRQLRKHAAQNFPAASRERFPERRIGAAAHRNVVVDVDQLAREATSEEPGYEQ